MSFFSIIIPCYNVETYIEECINSILLQSFSDYEVILVDDGSKDKTSAICDEFAKKEAKVDVIHKKNGGLSDARNTGLEKARGEYIIFIDSDDGIEVGTLEKFNSELKISNNPDVMITRIKKIFPDSNAKFMDRNMPIEIIKNGNKEDVIDWMFNHSNSLWPAVRYVVKRSFIEKNNLRFSVGYLHEDIDWTSRLFLYAEAFTALEFYWYNHRINRSGSITTNINPKRTLDVIQLVAKNIRDDKYSNININLRDNMFKRMVKSLFYSLSDFKYYSYEEKKMVIEALNQNRDVFKYTNEFRHKLFMAFSKVFGFKKSLTLMSIIHRA